MPPPSPRSPLRLLAQGYVAVCFAVAAGWAALFAWSSQATVEGMRYLPLPLALAPLGIGLIAGLWLGRRWALAAAGALLLFVFGVMDFSLGGLRPEAEGTRPLRVMTWNAKAFKADEFGGPGYVAWEVALHDADLILLQDSPFPTVADLPASLRSAFGDRQLYLLGQYVIASRYPLRECRPGSIDYGGESHRYARCVLEVGPLRVDVVNAHLISPREGLNAARWEGVDGIDDWRQNYAFRLTQADALVRDLAGHSGPLILAGDLNAPEHSPVVQRLLRLGLRDAFSSAGIGFGYTHGHKLRPRFSFLRIDHILVSRAIAVREVSVGGAASEHRAVIADLWLERR